MRDTYGRDFSYLRLSVTDVCNFSCSYCLPDGFRKKPGPSFMALDEIRRLATAFAALGMWRTPVVYPQARSGAKNGSKGTPAQGQAEARGPSHTTMDSGSLCLMSENKRSARKTIEELTRYLDGVTKKHGSSVELVVKAETEGGKVRRRTGRLLGVRDGTIGLRSDARSKDMWLSLDRVHDIWKKGAERE